MILSIFLILGNSEGMHVFSIIFVISGDVMALRILFHEFGMSKRQLLLNIVLQHHKVFLFSPKAE